MKQHKLRLDDLQIESFSVLPEAPRERGTVQGHLITPPNFTVDCTFADTCAISCRTCYRQITCNETCLCETYKGPTCGVTCINRCATDNCTGDIFCPVV